MADEIPAWARDDFDPESREAIERLRSTEARDPYEERSFEQIDYPRPAPDPYEERATPRTPASNSVVDRALRLTSDQFQSNFRPVVENGQINWGDQEMGGSAADFFRADAARMAALKAASEPQRTQLERPSGSAGSGRGPVYAAVAGDDNEPPILRAIRGAESSNNPFAKNPRSSASGLFQFTDGTWGSVLRRMDPATFGSYKNQQLAPLKTNPDQQALQKQAAKFHFENDILPTLRRAGIEATPGNIYLSWFQGPQGAVRAYRAPSDAKVSEVFPETVSANANMRFRGKPYAQWTMDDLREFTATAMSRRMRADGGQVGGGSVDDQPSSDGYASENDLLQPIGKSKMVGEEKPLFDEGVYKAGLSGFSSNNKKSIRYLHHDENNNPIGVLQIMTDGPRSKKATIQNVYVAENFRRNKIASGLLKRARQDFDVRHSTDLTNSGRAFARAVKAAGGSVEDYIPHDDPRRAQNLAKFMRESKAVDEAGNPKTLYHATNKSFSVFDPKRAAKNSGHPASRLGHFMAATPEAADLFSRVPDRYSEGTGEYRPGANIMPVHAAIKNPHVMHWKEFAAALAALNSMPDKKANKEVDAFRKQLIDAGHDGILIKGGWKPGQLLGSREFSSDNWVAFEPEQIKSATGNDGNFNPERQEIDKAEGGSVDEDEDEGITAYHGSPYDFPKFDINKIGAGEGAQSYGHGLYFAESEPVARSYRDKLSEGTYQTDTGKVLDPYGDLEHLNIRVAAGKSLDNAIDRARGLLETQPENADMINRDLAKLLEAKAENAAPRKGHMYEVRIKAHPDQFLDWDKSLDIHPEVIQDALHDIVSEAILSEGNKKFMKGKFQGALRQEEVKNPLNYAHLTGGALYNMLTKVFKPEDISTMLRERGVKGIKYLDQNSRQAGLGTRNYVVFNHDHVDIKRKYAQGGAVDVG